MIDLLLAEHINLPGVPGVVVTRHFAYQWMMDIGYDPSDRGFGSMDYLVFGKEALDKKLTDLGPLEETLASLAVRMKRDCFGLQ